MEAKILKWAMGLLCCIPIYFMVTLTGNEYIISKWGTGKGFPNENELTYETGYLKSRKDPYYCSRGHCKYYPTTILTKNLNMATGQEYYCHYNYGRKEFCFDTDFFKEYKNQPAKIGYYIQPDFLWYKDNTRQLATLEVNGKMVRDYQKSKEILEEMKKSDNLWLFMFIFVLIGICFLFVFGMTMIITFIKNGSVNGNKKRSS